MSKVIVETEKVRKIPGLPFSPAVKLGQWVFISGQVGDDPNSDVKVQTRQALEKTRSLLEKAGSSPSSVVKCTVFLADLSDYASMNEIYGAFFSEKPPARSCVEVKLVKDLKVEIESIAYIP